MRSRTLLSALLPLTLLSAASLGAQSRVTIAAGNRDAVTVGESGTATLVFAIRNTTSDTAAVQPALILPHGWSPLFRPALLRLAPGASDTWLAGIAVPPTVSAGNYVVRVSVGDANMIASDSAIVRVDERRAISIVNSSAPSFVGARDHYQATFFIRNQGNIPVQLGLKIHSGAASTSQLASNVIDLAPGGRAPVVVEITASNTTRSLDDVIELVATDPANEISESASARVLIVPRNTSGTSASPSLPAELAVRAANREAGVSPVVLRGAGPIRPGSATNIDFAFHAPVGKQSIFGERDEYRVDVLNPDYHLGLGDESRAFSQLTASGISGFGAGFETKRRSVNGGAYAQQNRWSREGAFEASAFLATDTAQQYSASTSLTGRNTGARAASLGVRAHIQSSSTIEVELGASDSANTTASAQRFQFTGNYDVVRMDLGAVHSVPTFAGPGRGIDQTHSSITSRPLGPVTLQLNTVSLHASPPPTSAFNFRQTYTTNELAAEFNNTVTLSYQVATKRHQDENSLLVGTQQGPRISGHYRLADFNLRGTMAYQSIRYNSGAAEPYIHYQGEVSKEVRSSQWIGVFGEWSSGSLFDGLSGGGVTAGGWTRMLLPLGLWLDFSGSAYLPRYGTASRNRSGDITLTRDLRNGSAISVRNHFTTYDRGISMPGMNATYLEFRTPLRIRTTFTPPSGRVVGRVTDATTGQGISKILVHIGDEAVITDSRGQVSLAGLRPGRYGVSIESRDRSGGNLLVGDVSVEVPDGSSRPATFAVSLAQSGHVRANIRLMAPSSGMGSAKSDSLIDAGAIENSLIALEGARDTIVLSTDSTGHLDFGRVAPGVWTVRIVSADIPEYHKTELDRMQVNVRPGETNDVVFRVIPVRRSIQIMNPNGGSAPIRATPERPRNPTQPRNPSPEKP